MLETLVDVRGEAVGVSDLAHVAELSKSTVHRFLKEKEAHGFVGREGMKYRLGPLLTEMPARTSRSDYDELRNCALPELERLFDRTSATVHLAVLAGAVVLYLEEITAVGGGHMPWRVGGTAPPTCTALGKAVLAFSDDRIRHNIPARLPRMTRYSIASPGCWHASCSRSGRPAWPMTGRSRSWASTPSPLRSSSAHGLWAPAPSPSGVATAPTAMPSICAKRPSSSRSSSPSRWDHSLFQGRTPIPDEANIFPGGPDHQIPSLRSNSSTM